MTGVFFMFALGFFSWNLKLGGIPVLSLLDSHQTVVYAYTSEAQTLDPALAKDPQSAKLISCIYEGLVRYKPGTLDIEPALASDWKISKDGLTYTFNLKKNILFHDGTPFRAQAVKYSIERQTKKGMASYYYDLVFGPLREVKVIDDYTVKLILSKPYAPLLRNLAMPYAAPVVSPSAAEKYGSAFGVNPTGTGPYTLLDWDKDISISLAVNPFYREPGPEVKKLIFKVIPQTGQRLTALLNGDVHLADSFTQLNTLLFKQRNIPYQTTVSNDVSYLGFYVNKPPFNNIKLRRAISMAINRGEKGDTGQLAIDNENILPPGVCGFEKNFKLYGYDPEKSIQILNDTVGNGFSFELITYLDQRPYNDTGGEPLAKFIQDQLAQVNIKVRIKTYNWEKYKRALLNQEGDAFLYGWISDSGDPDDFLYRQFGGKLNESGLNIFHYNNEAVNSLLEEGRSSCDLEQRQNIYARVQRLILSDAPLVPLNHGINILAVSPVIKNCILQRNGTCFLNRLN
jgi:peptide/nickel transport system substrate-binding protein